ncbi:unnamed protein product, partial [Meganyctiphanes norvegica]
MYTIVTSTCLCLLLNTVISKRITRHSPLKTKYNESIFGKELHNSTVSEFIIGGLEVVPHSYPCQVALWVKDDQYQWFCGGALISEEWILTSAFCANGAIEADVLLGAHNITSPEDTQVKVLAADFIVHEEFDDWTLANDIGLIKLEHPVILNDYVKTAILPNHNECHGDFEDKLVTATGWGWTSDDSDGLSPILNKVDMLTFGLEDCATLLTDITTKHICTRTSRGHGICMDDWGGPLHYINYGVTEVRGITSFIGDNGCQSGEPNVFTSVCSYRGWIQDNTAIIL